MMNTANSPHNAETRLARSGSFALPLALEDGLDDSRAAPQSSYNWHSSAGDFIEDDDGLGYADMGEEDDWSLAADENDAAAGCDGKKRKDGGKHPKGIFPMPIPLPDSLQCNENL